MKVNIQTYQVVTQTLCTVPAAVIATSKQIITAYIIKIDVQYNK